jgi:hypothetical protein
MCPLTKNEIHEPSIVLIFTEPLSKICIKFIGAEPMSAEIALENFESGVK